MKLQMKTESAVGGALGKKAMLAAAVAITIGVAALVPRAYAADGTITFTGSIVDATCSVTANPPGVATGTTGSLTVALPPISTGQLATAGKYAGSTLFSLTLGSPAGKTCSTTKVATMQVESGETPAIDLSNGYLKNTATGTSAGNVEIQLVNAATSGVIDLRSNNAATNNQPTATITSGAGTLNYVARYIATGTTTAGAVSSTLVYSISYN